MESPSSKKPRVARSLVQLFVLLTAGIGLASLLGWFLEIPLLASFDPDLIPMAPSTALCFVMLGVAMFFRVRWPGNRHAYLSSIFISSMILLSSLLLFLLSSIGAQSQIELLGFSIHGSFGGASLGHMSPVTAICFAASALSSLLTVTSSIEHHKRARAAVSLALFVFIASSVLLIGYFIGSPLMYGGSIIPPSLPTSLAFVLLSLGLIETSGRLIWENSKTQIAATSKTSAAFSMVFILLAAGILTGGYFAYRSFEHNFQTELENQLTTIAELKVDQLAQWRKERLGDGHVFNKNNEFSALVKRYIHNLNDQDSKKRILSWVSQVQAVYNYDFVMLLDGQLNTRLVFPESKERTRLVIDQRNAETLLSGEILFQDFYRNEQDQRNYLEVLVPILDDRSHNRLIAILALRIDPGQYLFPFIQRWPTPSKSAETLLMRRDGNNVLFLNPLRHRSDAALTLRVPLDKTKVPAVRAALGETGLMQGEDYRGEPVIACVRAVPGSPWYLVAKIDVAEVVAPLRERFWLMMVLICSLLLASGFGVGFVWRHQRTRFYEEHYASANALASSELRYRRLFESAKDGILILDPETGMVVDVNPFLVQLLDFPAEALLGRKIWELGFFKDVVANQDRFLELQKDGYVRYDDLPMETADGRRIDVEFVSNVYEAGLSKVIQCNIRDITGRRQAEEMARDNRMLHELRVHQIELEQQNEELRRTQKELETSRARYFDFYDLAPVGYITVSEKELILEANLTTATLLDVDRSALINQPITRFILKEDSDSYYLHRKKLNVNGEPQAFDLRMLKLGGAEFWVQLVTTVAQTAERAPVCRVVMSDITERKRAEEALRMSEEKFSKAFQTSPSAITITRPEGGAFIEVNGAFISMSGFSRAEAAEDSSISLKLWGDEKNRDEVISALREGRGVVGKEFLFRRKNGEVFSGLFSAETISINGKSCILSTINDITERKRAEGELRNLAADLKRSNTELEQFAYVASHDLQEPLRMISSYTTLLEKRYKDKLDQDANDFIGIVVDGAIRMQKMINALLVYSRTTRDHSPLQRVDCNAVIEDVKRNLQLSIQESGAIIQADPLPTIVGYPVLLLGLFQNVMSNSIKFQQGTKPLVAITVQKNNTHWIFSVKDNGIGIDPQYFDTIFIIFQRLHPIDEFPGTGIGLSICKNIVERHGGTIWVESEPHNGTTLYFTISSRLKEQ